MQHIQSHWFYRFSFLIFFIAILSFCSEKMAFIKSLAAGFLLLLSLYAIFKNKTIFIKNVKQAINEHKCFIAFNLWCLICIVFFTYSDLNASAFALFIKDWRYVIAIFLFLMAFQTTYDQKIKNIATSAFITMLFLTIFIYPFFINNPNDTRPFFTILRDQLGMYIAFLFPFVFSALFYYRSKWIKSFMALIILGTFAFLLYIGFRGVILSVCIEMIIILFCFRKNLMHFLMTLLGLFILLITIGAITYYSVPQFQHKVNQSLQKQGISSSRDVIISSRLPLFMDSTQNQLTGVGYNSIAYNPYLRDRDALKGGAIGFYDNQGNYVYNNDDPFLLTMIYNVGAIGLLLYLGALLINLKDIYGSLKVRKEVFNVSLMASGIGYFLVYCSFELVSMRLFFLFSVLTLLCLAKKK